MSYERKADLNQARTLFADIWKQINWCSVFDVLFVGSCQQGMQKGKFMRSFFQRVYMLLEKSSMSFLRHLKGYVALKMVKSHLAGITGTDVWTSCFVWYSKIWGIIKLRLRWRNVSIPFHAVLRWIVCEKPRQIRWKAFPNRSSLCSVTDVARWTSSSFWHKKAKGKASIITNELRSTLWR